MLHPEKETPRRFPDGAPRPPDDGVAARRQAILPLDDQQRNRLATLTARAARVGIEVRQQSDGSFLLRRWSYWREVSDLDELEQALRLQGVLA